MSEFSTDSKPNLDMSAPALEYRRERQAVDYITTSTATGDQRFADVQAFCEDFLLNDPRMPRYEYRQRKGEILLRTSPDPLQHQVEYLAVDDQKLKGYRLVIRNGSYEVDDAFSATMNGKEDIDFTVPQGAEVTAIRHEWKPEHATTDDPDHLANDGLAQFIDECRVAVVAYEATRPRKAGKSILSRIGLGGRSK